MVFLTVRTASSNSCWRDASAVAPRLRTDREYAFASPIALSYLASSSSPRHRPQAPGNGRARRRASTGAELQAQDPGPDPESPRGRLGPGRPPPSQPAGSHCPRVASPAIRATLPQAAALGFAPLILLAQEDRLPRGKEAPHVGPEHVLSLVITPAGGPWPWPAARCPH